MSCLNVVSAYNGSTLIKNIDENQTPLDVKVLEVQGSSQLFATEVLLPKSTIIMEPYWFLSLPL